MNEQPSIQVTEDVVLNSLRANEEPDLHKDVVALNMIRDVKICGGIVNAFCFVLTTPACPVRDQLKFEAERTVMAVPGVERVEVKMDGAEVPKARGVLDKAEIACVKHIIAVSSGKGGVGKSNGRRQSGSVAGPDGRESGHPRHRRLRPERADYDGRQRHAHCSRRDDSPARLPRGEDHVHRLAQSR